MNTTLDVLYDFLSSRFGQHEEIPGSQEVPESPYDQLASRWVEQDRALDARSGFFELRDSKLGTFHGIEVDALVRSEIMDDKRKIAEIEQRFSAEVQVLGDADLVVVTVQDARFGGWITRCHREYFPVAGREEHFEAAREAWAWDPGGLQACAALRVGARHK